MKEQLFQQKAQVLLILYGHNSVYLYERKVERI